MFIDVDRARFRAALGETSFYKDWKSEVRRRGVVAS